MGAGQSACRGEGSIPPTACGAAGQGENALRRAKTSPVDLCWLQCDAQIFQALQQGDEGQAVQQAGFKQVCARPARRRSRRPRPTGLK